MKFNAFALLLFSVHSALAQTGATVEGMVTNSVTHAAIPGVSVTLWTQKGVRYSVSATDSAGTFRVTGVEPGEYNLRYDKPGYVQVELPSFGLPRLRVGAVGTVRADVEMSAMGTLRGRVLDPEGKPSPKVTVEIGPFITEDTDAEGRFEFQDLRPGTYTLRAVPPRPVKASDGPQLVTTYYPSALDESEAERIPVRGGADLAGYEIHLRTSAVYRVRGVVLDETGKPAANANVSLLRPQTTTQFLAGRGMIGIPVGTQYFMNLHGPGPQEASTVSREDGTFELTAVRPGDWRLEAQADPRHDAHNEIYFVASSIVPVRVSDHDLEGVELRFESSFSVQLTADWGDRQPPGNPHPSVMLLPETGLMLGVRGQPDSSGGVIIGHVLPGRYRIVPTPGLPPGYYPAAVMVGGRDVLGQQVELSSATSAITVVYRSNPGSIRGMVEQGEGATILLWPDGPTVPSIVRSVQAGARGSFEFPNVPPGNYLVVAFDRIAGAGGSEPFVLGAVATSARVKLEEGGAESIQLSVTHWPD
jgi:hypothetical protein